MAVSVLTALALDQKSVTNRVTLIEENNTADGSFVLSTFLEQAVKKKHKIIILLFHNTIGHFYSISQKLGYNLMEHEKRGDVIVYDFLKLISNEIFTKNIYGDEDFLKTFLLELRQKIVDISESHETVLIVENIGNLLLLGFQLKYVIFFIHYIQTLLNEIPNLSITCLNHNFDSNESLALVNNLRHISYLNVIIDDLKTGKAVDISGKLTIKWRSEDMMQWLEPNEYHFQLLDKNINVFAPGTKYL